MTKDEVFSLKNELTRLNNPDESSEAIAILSSSITDILSDYERNEATMKELNERINNLRDINSRLALRVTTETKREEEEKEPTQEEIEESAKNYFSSMEFLKGGK